MKLIKSEAMHITLEVLLILSSVLIFRSAWMLLDKLGLDTISVIIIMLIIGIATTILIVNILFKHEKHH